MDKLVDEPYFFWCVVLPWVIGATALLVCLVGLVVSVVLWLVAVHLQVIVR